MITYGIGKFTQDIISMEQLYDKKVTTLLTQMLKLKENYTKIKLNHPNRELKNRISPKFLRI